MVMSCALLQHFTQTERLEWKLSIELPNQPSEPGMVVPVFSFGDGPLKFAENVAMVVISL